LESEGLKKELERYGRMRGKEQIEKDISSLKPKPPTPVATTPSAPVAPAPAAPKPSAPVAPAPAAPKPSAPVAPAPAAPKPSPVVAYMSAAAKARKNGDSVEMAKVRDMGMEIWRKSNPKLAAAASERERIRGTAQTDNPLMKGMRSRLPVTPTVQTPAVKDLGAGQQSLSQNKFAGQSPPKKEMKKEAYEIVLEYILSEGHADTLSEAHYVMMQMDAEHIRNIVEQIAPYKVNTADVDLRTTKEK
jgi:hypothetical protein